MYFFSYPSTFSWYSKQTEIAKKSVVLYTHNEQPELGSSQEQANLLNRAFAVHFFSSQDASRLQEYGLKNEKVRIVNGAIDVDIPSNRLDWVNREKIIVAASRFGYRKNPEMLSSLVKAIPEWNFVLLGRNWEDFVIKESLRSRTNFQYFHLDKNTRNFFFSKARIFLSTSVLEGGPVPLLESMFAGASPVVSNTGFAKDVIFENKEKHIFDVNENLEDIEEKIWNCPELTQTNRNFISQFNWDRIARMLYNDFYEINFTSKRLF